MVLHSEDILLRWMNYHLKRAEHPRTASNFDKDIMDGEIYTIILNQLDPEECDLSGLEEKIKLRCKKVLKNAKAIGVDVFIKHKDISRGSTKLNQLFVAAIFNACPGLEEEELAEEELEEIKAVLIDKDGDPREERAFKMWINSLGIEDL